MLPAEITPTRFKKERAACAYDLRDLREQVKKARALRATGRVLDMEDADSILVNVHHWHSVVRTRMAWLRTVLVVKNCHLSGYARARAGAR